MFVSIILPEYQLAREAVYTTTFSRMDNHLEGPSRRFDAGTVVGMIESGLFQLMIVPAHLKKTTSTFQILKAQYTIIDPIKNFSGKHSKNFGYRVNF